MLKIGRRSVQHAREVLDEGAPELIEAVDSGNAAVSAASEVATKAEGSFIAISHFRPHQPSPRKALLPDAPYASGHEPPP